MSGRDTTPPAKKSWAEVAADVKTSSPAQQVQNKPELATPAPPKLIPKETKQPPPVTTAKPLTTCPTPTPLERGWPLGFKSKEQFENCMQDLCTVVQAQGLKCKAVGVRGSAVTYYSKNPHKKGRYFDKNGKKSDIDVFFVTDSRLASTPTAKGFFHPDLIKDEFEAISDWNEKWSGELGRDVTAAACKSSSPNLKEEHISHICKNC